MSKKNLSPQDKLLQAVFGVVNPTREQIEDRLIVYQAESITDEEFQKVWGVSLQEHTDRMMLYAGWCECITQWQRDHSDERKYHLFGNEASFSLQQVIDIAQMVYRQGQKDGRNGVSERDRLLKLNREATVK